MVPEDLLVDLELLERRATRDQEEGMVDLAVLATTASQVLQVEEATMGTTESLEPKDRRAGRGPEGPRVHLAPTEMMEMLDLVGPKVNQAGTVNWDSQGKQDPKGHLVLPDNRATKPMTECLAREVLLERTHSTVPVQEDQTKLSVLQLQFEPKMITIMAYLAF